MQSRTKFADQKRMHRRAFKTWILYVTCMVSVAFSITQTTILFVHCGREFRNSFYIDPRSEAILMSIIQMALPVVGIIGIGAKRGAVFFVGISFCICTVMIQHSVDLSMGLIYTYMYGRTIPTMELFLEKYYSKYEFNMFARIKIDKIHHCKKCCGIHGPDEDYVKLQNMSLIESCCPTSAPLPCTISKAYKAGCATYLVKLEPAHVRYQIYERSSYCDPVL